MATDPTGAVIGTSEASLGGWYGTIGALLAVVLAAPIWVVDYPPLVDYPNHLARCYILYHYKDVPSFGEYLDLDTRPVPNLAIDFFLLALQPLFDVRSAGKIFLTITLWLWLAGWHLLGCAIHGKPTWLALGGALAAYHSMFLYGFVNYAFGLGMFLVATAAWLQWCAHRSWQRFLIVTLLALACYFSHMSALLFLAGTALAVTLWDMLQQRKNTGMMLVLLTPVLVPFAFFLRGGSSGGSIVWSSLTNKLVGSLCLFRGYDQNLDAGFIAVVAIFLFYLFRWPSQRRVCGSVMFAGLGCVFMFLIAPYEIFGGMPADARFLPAAAALVILSLDFTYPRNKRAGVARPIPGVGGLSLWHDCRVLARFRSGNCATNLPSLRRFPIMRKSIR